MKGGEHNEESKENKRSNWPVSTIHITVKVVNTMKKVKKIKEAIGPCAVRGPYIPQK
jgi:hypothetical protein